ncbi:MAG TPA: hypothetical protein VG847_11245 [Chitinophagaceae bacterium]|nr:hypothetical protein [Chitinophagaceae bacterium]
MADNNYDNQIDWRQHLANLQDTEDAFFNREFAWNRLHQRLQHTRQKKKFAWYWPAAALIAAILIISFFIANKNEQVLVQHNPPESINNTLPADTLITARQYNIEHPAPVTIVNAALRAVIKNGIAHHIIKKAFTPPLVEITNRAITEKAIIDIAATPIDTAVSIVATMPAKKRLKVVHVNELGDPAGEPFQYKKYNDNVSVHFRFMNQQVFDLPSAEAKTDHKIFTIKTN